MLPAYGMRQHTGRVALVEEEDLAIRDRSEVDRYGAERDALATARRAEDGGVAGIVDVEVEAKRGAAGGRAIAERRGVLRIVGTGIGLESRPDAGERQDIGEVLGIDQRTPDVEPAVSRQRAEIGLRGVDSFDARLETHVLAGLEDQLRILVGGLDVILSDDDLRGYVAVPDGATFGLGDRFVRVGGHPQGVLILESRTGARAEVLADHHAQAEPFLEPVAAVGRELADGGARPDRDTAHRVAIANRQFAEEGRHLGIGKGREARERNHSDMASTDPRTKACDKVLVADNGVEVGRHARRTNHRDPAVDAGGEMRQQLRQQEWCQLPDRADGVDEFAQLRLKPVELFAPVGALRHARQKNSGDAGLRLSRRPIRDSQYTAGLAVTTFGGVLKLALTFERGADQVRKVAHRIVDARVADEVDVVHEAVVEPGQRAIGLRPMRVQLLDARRIEIRSRAFEARKERAVLERDGAVIERQRVVELIGQSAPPIFFSSEIPELPEDHKPSFLPHTLISLGLGTDGRIWGGGASIEARAG